LVNNANNVEFGDEYDKLKWFRSQRTPSS